MHHTDLIHVCLKPDCLDTAGAEARTEEQHGRIHVTCCLCGSTRDYPKEALNRMTVGVVQENLRGLFKVEERYV